LSQSSNDDNDQFYTIHPLSTDKIRQSTEDKLANDCSARCSYLDSGIRRCWHRPLALGPVDCAQHDGEQRNDEDIVGIGEESSTSHNTSSHMVPAKGSLVDLSESETTALVGIRNVSKVIVEVVESGIASWGLLDNGSWNRGRHGY